MNKFDLVREFVNEGYTVPMDLAVSLLGEGYDVSEFDKSYDGYSIEDYIEMKEMYEQ